MEVIIHKGDYYGRLRIISEMKPYITYTSGQKYRQFRCECECGKIIRVLLKSLRSGHTQSCGCLTIDVASTHNGASLHPLYVIWMDMNRRCYSPLHVRYSRYGGRGIKVCSQWSKYNSNGFWNFVAWEESLSENERQFSGSMLDRKNNDGNYTPNNCRFVTPIVSSRNRRNVIMVTKGKFKGKALIEVWEELGEGIKYDTFYRRYCKGLNVEEAIL